MSGTMPEGTPLSSREEFEKEVLRRARADAGFRAQLLVDPKAALKTAFGVELPPDIEIRVLEETPTRFFIVLPVEKTELSDEDLAQVAGGFTDVKGVQQLSVKRVVGILGERQE